MRLLISETWRYFWYGQILFDRFKELGVETFAFKEHEFSDSKSALARVSSRLDTLVWRVQYSFRVGPWLSKLNRALRHAVAEIKPDAALFVRGDLIYPETVRELKTRGVYIFGCNNDNPFSPRVPRYAWRHLIGGLPYYDRYLPYRHSNIPDFKKAQCPRVDVLRSFYIKEVNRPLDSVSGSSYLCDISFTGHWENDGREALIEALLNEPGVKTRLWGPRWERAGNYGRLKDRLGEMRPLVGEDYNLAINSSKIALVFLSALNQDTYTRRCFEIPAAGTFMLAQRTDDLKALFSEGVEAEYFSSQAELLDKTRFYLKHEDARKKIAAAGRARLLRDGHEAMDRVKEMLAYIQNEAGKN